MPNQPQRVPAVPPSSFGTVLDLAGQLPWAARFALAAAAGVVLLLAVIWAMTGFGSLGSTRPPRWARAGHHFAVALAVALMTLIFYSNRSGQDDIVAGVAQLDLPDGGETSVQEREDRGALGHE